MLRPLFRKFFDRSTVWARQNRQRVRLLGAIGAAGSTYYVLHLETVPITGRVRFVNVSAPEEKTLSERSANEILRANRHCLLPQTSPTYRRILSIVNNLASNIAHFVPGAETNFTLYVLDSPEANAFVLPDGQIFVYTGLLPVARNDDGLATVLAHEIAHRIARHGAEKLSTYQFFSLLIGTAQLILTGDFNNPLTNFMKTMLLDLPFSRKCESEADYIGLLLMARSCYRPDEAVRLWQQMSQASPQTANVASFLSTHPSHAKRIESIQSWLAEARLVYDDGDCSNGLLTSFNKGLFSN